MIFTSFKKNKIDCFVFALVVVVLLFYFPYFWDGGFLGNFGDPIGQTIPNKFLLTEYLKHGVLPFWNPYSFLGMPFLADIQVGAFYLPDILLFIFFKPFIAYNFSILIHVIFGGLGFYYFGKKLFKNTRVAFLISLVFCLSGTLLTKMYFLNLIETIVYVPWILLCVLDMKKIFKWIPVFFCLMVFAGHPIVLLYSLIIISIFSFIYYFDDLKCLFKILISLAIGFSISLIQIIPFLDFKSASVRDALTFQQFTEGSLNLKLLIGFLVPLKMFKTILPSYFDLDIHFGLISFLLLCISVFFYRKFNDSQRKIFIIGIVLTVLGLILSLGGTFELFSRVLFHVPVFNLVRVPARYAVVFHFGALLCIGVFLSYIYSKYRKFFIFVFIAVFINTGAVFVYYLDRNEIRDAQSQYEYDFRTVVEKDLSEKVGLNSIPKYFVNSSFFLYPSRHFMSFSPSVGGYNPMIPKVFADNFSYFPSGAFSDPDYFINYYDKFNAVGLKYYVFPDESFLRKKNLNSKVSVIEFLKKNKWENIAVLDSGGNVWKSHSDNEFVSLLNSENLIKKIDFEPGKIVIQYEAETNDKIIVNQSYFEGWKGVYTDSGKTVLPEKYDNLVQSYEIKKGVGEITFSYFPKSIIIGAFGSLIGVLLYFFVNIKLIKIKK